MPRSSLSRGAELSKTCLKLLSSLPVTATFFPELEPISLSVFLLCPFTRFSSPLFDPNSLKDGFSSFSIICYFFHNSTMRIRIKCIFQLSLYYFQLSQLHLVSDPNNMSIYWRCSGYMDLSVFYR